MTTLKVDSNGNITNGKYKASNIMNEGANNDQPKKKISRAEHRDIQRDFFALHGNALAEEYPDIYEPPKPIKIIVDDNDNVTIIEPEPVKEEVKEPEPVVPPDQPGYENGVFNPDAPGAVPVVVDVNGNIIPYTPGQAIDIQTFGDIQSVNTKVDNTGRLYIPPPLLRLDTNRYRTVKERLEFFAKNGRFFTNNNITESRDHYLDNKEFVYPVFRISNEYGKFNPLRAVNDTYPDSRYPGYYFPLNKYKSRLAALLNKNVYLSNDRPSNPDSWYDYAWYEANSDATGDLEFPLKDITMKDFKANRSGARLLAHEAASFFDKYRYYIELITISTVSITGGVITGIMTERPKWGLYAAGGLFLVLFAGIGSFEFVDNLYDIFNHDDIDDWEERSFFRKYWSIILIICLFIGIPLIVGLAYYTDLFKIIF